MLFGKQQPKELKRPTDDNRAGSIGVSVKEVEDTQKSLEAEKIYREGTVTLRDLIAPTAVRVLPDHLEVSGVFARSMFVTTYPRYIANGWFDDLINYSATFDVSIYCFPLPSHVVLKQLRDKVGVIEAELNDIAEHSRPRDPMRETALRDMEKLRDDLTQGIEHFFQYGMYLTLYGKTLEELNQLTERVEGMFGSKLVFTRRALWQAEQGFNTTLPLGNDELNVYYNLNTSPIASAFPFVSSELTSDSGVLYGVNRHNNSLILFDRFSLQNANSVVFATSGAGKSYAIKLEVLRSLMLGTEVIIVDPEHEYKHLSDAVGGTYISISLNSASKINPFDLPKAVGDDEHAGDILRSAVITMKGLLRVMLGEFTHQEDSLMDRAILETYAKKDITAETDLAAVTHENTPVMKDLQEILEGMSGGQDLAERLKKYTEGTFAGLLNHPTNVSMENQLVVFSVRDLEDELRPMAIYSIINYIWNLVRSSMKKRVLVIDEAWWLMQHEDSAKFVFALAKRCRKYYLGLTTITQDVNDFLGSPYGQAIVTNSSIQLLLRQSPASIDVVAKTFLLTEGERYLLLESGVGEGIFFAGNKHVAVKVVASYAEDQIITSDPRQLLEIEEAKKQFAEQAEAAES